MLREELLREVKRLLLSSAGQEIGENQNPCETTLLAEEGVTILVGAEELEDMGTAME